MVRTTVIIRCIGCGKKIKVIQLDDNVIGIPIAEIKQDWGKDSIYCGGCGKHNIIPTMTVKITKEG